GLERVEQARRRRFGYPVGVDGSGPFRGPEADHIGGGDGGGAAPFDEPRHDLEDAVRQGQAVGPAVGGKGGIVLEPGGGRNSESGGGGRRHVGGDDAAEQLAGDATGVDLVDDREDEVVAW